MIKDLILSGYHVPAGTQVDFLVYHMSRDERVFPDVEAFRPERWLREQSNKFNETKEVFASIPFGFGTRMCPGRRIAEYSPGSYSSLTFVIPQTLRRSNHISEESPFQTDRYGPSLWTGKCDLLSKA